MTRGWFTMSSAASKHWNGSYLIRMSDSAFADLPKKVVPRTVRLKDPTITGHEATKWIFIGYCETLLCKNAKLQELLERFVGRRDDPDCWDRLTQGQQVLYSLAELDGQVRNGGITQFFWNCADLVLPVSGSLAVLGESGLLAAYERTVANLTDRTDAWNELRHRSRDDPDSFREPFQASYDLVDLTWFDDEYFKTFGPPLVMRLVDYVRGNKHEFIDP